MSMTEIHRKILEKVAPDLLNDLDFKDIVPYLLGDEAITRHDRDKINTKATRRKKVAALLDILPRRGDGAYISLQYSLTKTAGSMHLYETMKKHEEQYRYDQLQQELEEEKSPLQGTSSSEDNSTRGLGRSKTLQAGEEPPDDEFAHILRQIAGSLYVEAKINSLAGQLGILHGDIQRAHKTNVKTNRVTSDGTRHMLNQWRRGVSREEERMELRKALRAVKLFDLADMYLREVPLASIELDFPGASALAGEVSTFTAREVSDAMLNKLAKQIPGDDYDTFSEKLSIPHNQARTILKGYCNDYAKATRDCMAIWMNKSTRNVADLHGVLRAADLGGLIVHCD